MKICIINPNTSKLMTTGIGESAERIAQNTTEIICFKPDNGPESIEGYYDEVFGALGTLEGIKRYPEADGYVIACFDDTGLDAARTTTIRPVIGIGEAGFHTACLVAEKFTVITTLPRSINAIRNNLRKYGLLNRCANIRASEIPVLDLETVVIESKEIISNQIIKAIKEDGAEAIVLGCAGMSNFAIELSETHSIPVIDGVASAVCLIESLVRLGIQTSKLGGYEQPRKKKFIGSMRKFEPK